MKYAIISCFLLLTACLVDNKTYPLKMGSLHKIDQNYQLIVSTEINLDELNTKQEFTEQQFIGEIKNRDFRDKSIIITGTFDTKNQKKIEIRYFYTVDLMITDREKQKDLTYQLTEKDTISGFLQLSYEMGRTYPTKSIDLPADLFLSASK